MIFQEPMSSLSPVHRIGTQIGEALRIHFGTPKHEQRERVLELLRQVEIPRPESAIDRYTFEFSGGMRQRVMIAMALACKPSVLIADEPTTALDVTTQAEILDLIRKLQQSHGMAVLFITHDMGVVAEIADDVLVMYRGKVMESGSGRADLPRAAGRLYAPADRLRRQAGEEGGGPGWRDPESLPGRRRSST